MQLPGVSGDVQVTGHEGWIAIDSVGYEFAREESADAKTGTQDINLGVARRTAINASKSLDSASTHLMQLAIAGGVAAKTALIRFIEIGGVGETKPTVFLEIQLDAPVIQSWSLSGSDADRPGESLAILYNKIALKYWTISDGKPDASPSTTGWDFVYNKPWAV